MKDDIKIEGIEDLERVMESMRRQFGDKVAVSGIRSALGIFRKRLAAAYSTQNSGLVTGLSRFINVSSKKVRNERIISAGVNAKKAPRVRRQGSDGRRGVSSGYMPAYTAAYWQNYGTLSGRMPGHKFKSSAGKNSKNPKGIKYSGVIEETWEMSKMQVIAEIPKRCQKAMERLEKKERKR